MSENVYERFRSILLMNLYGTMPMEQVDHVLKAVDISMHSFDIKRKDMDIIPAYSTPEVLKYFLASKAIANIGMGTLKQYKYKLDHFFKTVNKCYADISTNDIRIYLFNFKAERGICDRYLDNVRITINTMFQWLVNNDYIQKNPCANVDKIKYQEKRRQPMTQYELEYVRWNTKDVREKALIDFLFSTGCRITECADVRLDDINWGNRSIHIRHGKGDKERTVFFNAEAEVSMRKYLDSRTDDINSLFVTKRKPYHPMKKDSLELVVRKVARRTGIETYPHKLRHTFATFGLHSGMPLEKLQLLLGHANPQTTLIYAKQEAEDVKHEYSRVFS